jgi:hypothetical protein
VSLYRVVGGHPYRDTPPGDTFEAALEPAAEKRALACGAIRIIERRQPSLQPDSYQLPEGWATTHQEE